MSDLFTDSFLDELVALQPTLPLDLNSKNMVAERYWFSSIEMAQRILDGLSSFNSTIIHNGQEEACATQPFTRVNSELRFISYPLGGFIAPHTDGVRYACVRCSQSRLFAESTQWHSPHRRILFCYISKIRWTGKGTLTFLLRWTRMRSSAQWFQREVLHCLLQLIPRPHFSFRSHFASPGPVRWTRREVAFAWWPLLNCDPSFRLWPDLDLDLNSDRWNQDSKLRSQRVSLYWGFECARFN